MSGDLRLDFVGMDWSCDECHTIVGNLKINEAIQQAQDHQDKFPLHEVKLEQRLVYYLGCAIS